MKVWIAIGEHQGHWLFCGVSEDFDRMVAYIENTYAVVGRKEIGDKDSFHVFTLGNGGTITLFRKELLQ